MAFFSVVIPAYNSAAFLPATIASLQSQSFRDFEVILVDDNSTDSTAAVARKLLGDSGISYQVIVKPEGIPQGVSYSRNIGIEKASGEWIALLDSDDFFCSEKLETLHHVIKEHNQPMLIHHPLEWVDEQTLESIGSSLNQSPPGFLQEKDRVFTENFIGTSSVCLPKAVFEKTGYFETDLNGVEDFFLWMKVSKQYPVFYINKLLGKYRMRNASLMSGRKFGYYLQQNARFISKMRDCGLFSKEELNACKDYMLGSLLRYYASQSITQHGLRQFLASFYSMMVVRARFGLQLYYDVLKMLLLQSFHAKLKQQ